MSERCGVHEFYCEVVTKGVGPTRDLSDSAHGGPQDWVSHYDIIAFVCTVTSLRVGCGCTVRSFTTLGECGLSLSLGLRPKKTHS